MKRLDPVLAACSVFCLFLLTAFTPMKPSGVPALPFLGGIIDLDTVDIRLDDCGASGTLCLPLQLAQALKLRVTDNGQPVAVTIDNGCDFDTSSAYTYSTLFGQGSFGPYLLTSWPVGSMVFSDTFNTMPELVDSMNVWDPLGDWMLDPAHLLITGGFPGNQYDTMKVWVLQIQTPSFIGYNFGTTPRGTELSFAKGFHTVILEDTLTQMSDTFYVRVSCTERAMRMVDLDSTGVFCLNFDDLSGAPESVSICNPTGGTVEFELTNGDSCVQYTGLSVGESETCLVACDSSGFCDTTWLRVRVRGQGALYSHFIEIPAGETGTFCLDTLDLTGPVASVNFCGVDTDGFASFSLDAVTNCIQYEGLMNGGLDTVCVAACDAAGVCDTTLLAVKVRRFGPEWVYDTLFLNKSGRHCADAFQFNEPQVALEVFKEPNLLNLFYSLDQLAFCTNYVGLKPTTDTIGVRQRDGNNNFDSTFLVVTVLRPALQILYDTLGSGETTVFCFDTSELAGTNLIIDNVCKNSSNDDVAFDINPVTLCLEMQALTPGTDTACITVCDNLGVCDSIILIITALDGLPNPQPPVARPDNGITEGGMPVQIPVLTNDTIQPAFTALVVLPSDGSIGPLHGAVSVDAVSGIITYTPDSSFCNSTDNFRYVVCNSAGCDTALVTVMVTCDEDPNDELKFRIYDAFSPNGDTVNDFFTIMNPQKYPDHLVQVFNRWGNLVMIREQYQNDWDGTWNGSPLPDGVYFYAFHTGEGKVFRGALHIRR